MESEYRKGYVYIQNCFAGIIAETEEGKTRIAKGAGVDIAEVNRLVKQFEQAKKMMKQMPGLMGGKKGKRGRFSLPF